MKKFLLLMLSALFSISIIAQIITGSVTESGSGYPLIGVNVIVEGTAIGVTTDIDGKYKILVKPEYKNLVFTYIGYSDVVEPLDGRTEINVKLGEQSSILNQVVISASKRKEKVLNAPASISVITSEKLAKQTALTAIDNMKKTPGVDIMTTGLVSANVNLRGFNGIFNGSMLTMVDNRIGSVPSLRVNAFQLIPGNNYDMEKIEIIRGPGSALYGPNAADGVMHIITKSPLDIKGNTETTLSLTTGLRQVVAKDSEIPDAINLKKGDFKIVTKPEFRTAVKLSDNFAFKVSGRYMVGQDWEFWEPGIEPNIGQPILFGTAANGEPWEIDNSFHNYAPFVYDTLGNTIDLPVPDRFNRDFSIQNYNLDFRADYRFPDTDSELVFAAGNSRSANLELTGLGAARASGWNYNYGQLRYRNKGFYAQYFLNSSNAGDQTYLIPRTGDYEDDSVRLQLLVDKSQLHVVQLQNQNEIDKLKLIYGFDYLATRPRTEGTINGRNEEDDNFNQVGGYVQGEYKFSEAFSLTAATRLDYTDIIDEYQLSPRVAAVYKPDPKHTLRATYNRAFSTPSNFAYSLDLANGRHPLYDGTTSNFIDSTMAGVVAFDKDLNPNEILMDIGGASNNAGYQYDTDNQGNIVYSNFWTGQNESLSDNTNNHLYLDNLLDVLIAQFVDAAPDNLKSLVPSLIGPMFTELKGVNGKINDIDLVGIDFVEFLTNGDAVESLYNENGAVNGDIRNIGNFERQTSEITETYELGYKGIFNDKFYLSTDFYYTKKSNIRSGLRNRSPFVVFDPVALNKAFFEDLTTIGQGPDATKTVAEFNVSIIDNLLAANGGDDLATLLEGTDFAVDIDPDTEGLQTDGNAIDELENIINGLNAQIGVGIATPTNNDAMVFGGERPDLVGNDMILTYVNLGNANIFGTDIGFTYVFNKDLTLQGAASLVNASELKAVDDDGNETGDIVYFNAPAKKFSLGLDHSFPRTGFGYGLNFRMTEAFFANSAPYLGQVNNVLNFDAKINYSPKKIEGLQFTLDINNLLSYNWFDTNEDNTLSKDEKEWGRFQNFPGTPFLGRIAFFNIAYTFGN